MNVGMANQQRGPAQNPNGAAAVQPVAPGALVRFARGAKRCRLSGTPITSTLGSNAVNQQHAVPVTNGWNRRIALIVSVATTGNSATVALGADSPWNLFSQITVRDAKQNLRYQLRGYSGYIAELFGGYHLYKTDGDTDGYTALTTGSGATAPTGSFVIEIPHEAGREGLFVEPNADSSQKYTIDIAFNTLATAFGTAPNGTTTVTVQPVVHFYQKPPAVDGQGNSIETTPPMAGAVQYWREQTLVVSSGANIIPVNASGRMLRNMIGIFTDGSDVRSNTVRPDLMRIDQDNNTLIDIPRLDMASWLYKRFGYVAPTGVYPFWLGTLAPDIIPGGEWVDEYLETSTASQFVFRFTAGAAGKLYLLMNELQFPIPLPADV